MNKKILAAVVILLIILSLAFVFTRFKTRTVPELASYDKLELSVNESTLTLYVADTDGKQAQGLSNVQHLPQDTGMIFTYATPDYHYFWMKDMLFPLDFMYLNEGTIVDLKESVPADEMTPFTSKVPADAIVEVPIGTIERLQVEIGDVVTLSE